MDFGFCLDPFRYEGRPSRFVVDYHKISTVPGIDTIVMKSARKVNGDSSLYQSLSKGRISYRLPSNSIFRCQFSPKLITDDPKAEVLLSAIKNAVAQQGLDQNLVSFYVMDEAGLDIPLVPGPADLPLPDGKDLLLPIAIVGVGLLIASKVLSSRE